MKLSTGRRKMIKEILDAIDSGDESAKDKLPARDVAICRARAEGNCLISRSDLIFRLNKVYGLQASSNMTSLEFNVWADGPNSQAYIDDAIQYNEINENEYEKAFEYFAGGGVYWTPAGIATIVPGSVSKPDINGNMKYALITLPDGTIVSSGDFIEPIKPPPAIVVIDNEP
jgi:hypothetical protein